MASCVLVVRNSLFTTTGPVRGDFLLNYGTKLMNVADFFKGIFYAILIPMCAIMCVIFIPYVIMCNVCYFYPLCNHV